MRRILVIRGGAIGDFVLTLPAIGALRTAFPKARLEILGYKHIVALAEQRFYADAVRSIEYGALSAFFGRGAELPRELSDYFSSFDLIVSYLFDPDGDFERNLRRSGADEIIRGVAKVTEGEHAALQLARVTEEVGLRVEETAARIYPSASDREFASAFSRDAPPPIIAIHAGSGSERKNWSLERWIDLSEQLSARASLLFIGGEADREKITILRSRFHGRALFADNLPLPLVAAAIERCGLFLGHDSGISHIAAAVGIPSILLFGASDPRVWAPRNTNARVIRAPDCDLTKLPLSAVAEAIDQELMRIGIST